MLDLLDYRRRVTEMYRLIRVSDDPHAAWKMFRQTRDDLFYHHPQSPLDEKQKAAFSGLRYYDYDPAYRMIAAVDTAVEPETLEYELGEDGIVRCTRFGKVSVTLPTGAGTLSLFWINGYGGGVFLPFGDTANRQTTYGAGRYLYDTIKGADLGASLTEIVLDFNFAYSPSCAYNPRWVCPLAPPENRLPFPIPAGEMKFPV